MSATSAVPLFHFTPAVGWMNDPNGLIHHRGVHHLFFQHNPVSVDFGDISWGHAASVDLLHWTQQPTALSPGDEGDYDRDGCWSGCAVTLPDGSVAVLYSANHGARQLPALAYAVDEPLVSWKKAPENPVIPAWPPIEGLTDLRDHAVVRVGDRWRQVLAAGSDPTKGGIPGMGGQLVSYLSAGNDLTSWEFEGVLLDGAEAGLPGDVFECPDLFTAPGCAEGELVVVLSWYAKVVPGEPPVATDVLWLTGSLDGKRFTPTRSGRLDLGDRFYAPQSYATADGRRLQFGWLRTQHDPESAGRASVGAQSLPRSLSVVGGRLVQEPARELEALLRTPLGRTAPGSSVSPGPRPAAAVELVVTAAGPTALPEAVVVLEGPDGHVMRVPLTPFARESLWLRRGGEWHREHGESTTARVLVDRGIVEIFSGDGRAAATSDLALEAVTRVSLEGPPGVTAEVASLALPS